VQSAQSPQVQVKIKVQCPQVKVHGTRQVFSYVLSIPVTGMFLGTSNEWQNVNGCYAVMVAVDGTHCMTVNERSVINTGERCLERGPANGTLKTKSTTVQSTVRVPLNSGKSERLYTAERTQQSILHTHPAAAWKAHYPLVTPLYWELPSAAECPVCCVPTTRRRAPKTPRRLLAEPLTQQMVRYWTSGSRGPLEACHRFILIHLHCTTIPW